MCSQNPSRAEISRVIPFFLKNVKISTFFFNFFLQNASREVAVEEQLVKNPSIPIFPGIAPLPNRPPTPTITIMPGRRRQGVRMVRNMSPFNRTQKTQSETVRLENLKFLKKKLKFFSQNNFRRLIRLREFLLLHHSTSPERIRRRREARSRMRQYVLKILAKNRKFEILFENFRILQNNLA